MRVLSAPMVVVPALPRTAPLLTVLAAGLGLALAAAGCPHEPQNPLATLPAVTTDDPEAEADLQAAREAAEQDRAEEAQARYEDFLEDHPRDPLVPVAKLGLGRLLLAEGESERAMELFEQVARHDDPSVAERGRFYRGVALHLAGRHGEALETLRPFVGRTVDPAETALLLRTIGASSLHLGDRIGAVEAFDKLARASVPEDAREEARERIESIIADGASDAEIHQLYDRLAHDGYAWPLVAHRALKASYEAGDMTRVRAIIEAMREQDLELDEEMRAVALRAERTGEAEPQTVGAILPLSGRGREVGQLALRGLMLAAGTPPRQPLPPDAPRLEFRDDGGDPAQAVEAVDDLVSVHRVVAIVGPVEGEAARRAAERAQELGVPLIALSPAEGLTDVGSMIFRQFFTPDDEARELVAAARRRGARRFAVLRPESGYGKTMQQLFEQHVASAGGEVVARATYPADTTSFGKAIRELGRTRFDALFVPDASSRLALVAPALASAGLWSRPADAEPPEDGRAITLLAPSVGFAESLARDAGRYLQGALFALPFHAQAADGAGRSFAAAYEERYGQPPEGFAAYAYDAFKLVRRAVEQGATTREALAERLRGMRDVPTAGPSGGFTDGGEPARGPNVYELRGETLRRTSRPRAARAPAPTAQLR